MTKLIHKNKALLLVCSCLWANAGLFPVLVADDTTSPSEARNTVDSESSARSTAVALNYCRGSFHRLRQNPSKRVWYEEQHHILNNLNLNEIGDQEVISLYTAVLDEISKERIAEKERVVLRKNYKNQINRQFLSTAFVLGAEVTTAQYVNAVRTGCNSWWDYRNATQSRDLDLWRVEKTRLTEVNEKSTKFLETFWKMAQKKSIPDHWLVRSDDLEKLEAALLERNPEVRLRVLQRMEKFMECYPPFYYHVARTQQAMGQLTAAVQTYEKLASLGAGHFRKDDMLASGTANLALIQSYLKNPVATASARRALEFSTGVWQANLVCAKILQQGGAPDEAEEAILRNVDVDLERPQSLGSLVSLYESSRQDAKLISLLSDPKKVNEIPALPLIHASAKIGVGRLPPVAFRQLVTSIYAYDQSGFGQSQLVCIASPAWRLDSADTVLLGQKETPPFSRGHSTCGQTQLSYIPRGNVRMAANGEPEIVMEIRYPEGDPVQLHLKRRQWSEEMLDHVQCQTGRAGEIQDLLSMFTDNRRRTSYVITEAQMGGRLVAFWDRSEIHREERDPILVDKKREDDASKLHRTNKPAVPVTIEDVSPTTPLKLEKRSKDQTDPLEQPPVAAPPPIELHPARKGTTRQLFLPVPSPRAVYQRGPIQLGDHIEPIDD